MFAGTYRGNYQLAIKTLQNTTSDEEDDSSFNGLLKEAVLMTLVIYNELKLILLILLEFNYWTPRQLRHKNLVQLVGVVFDGPKLQMIAMELMSRVIKLRMLS